MSSHPYDPSAHVPRTDTRTPLSNLGPSCKFVYHVLEREGPLSRAEIEEITRLPRQTVHHALRQLRDVGVVEVRTHPSHANSQHYALSPEAPGR